MKMFGYIAGIASAIVLSMAFFATPASAQATRTWVSGVGDDANPCSRTAPCKTFAGSIAKTAAGGEIDCLDPGGFGTVTITKSIVLDCGGGIGGQAGSILGSGTNGIVIAAGSTDVVKIRNMTINGAGTTPGLAGIKFLTGGALIVEHVGIFGFGNGSTSGTNGGVDFEPNAAARLEMTDVEVQFCLSDGVLIKPGSSGSVNVTLNHVSSLNNKGAGVREDGRSVSSGFSTNVTISNSNLSGDSGGLEVFATATSKPVLAEVTTSVLSQNTNYGVRSDGAHAIVAVGGSNITGNSTGFSSVSSGVIKTFQDNYLFNGLAGTSNGASTGTASKL
jgi:hypothetical protein